MSVLTSRPSPREKYPPVVVVALFLRIGDEDREPAALSAPLENSSSRLGGGSSEPSPWPARSSRIATEEYVDACKRERDAFPLARAWAGVVAVKSTTPRFFFLGVPAPACAFGVGGTRAALVGLRTGLLLPSMLPFPFRRFPPYFAERLVSGKIPFMPRARSRTRCACVLMFSSITLPILSTSGGLQSS